MADQQEKEPTEKNTTQSEASSQATTKQTGSDVFDKVPEAKPEAAIEPAEVQPEAKATEKQVEKAPETTIPKFTKEEVGELLKQAVGAATTPAAKEKEYTQSDFDKAFNVVRPTVEQLNTILAGGDAGHTALIELLHATARQAVTMAAYQSQQIKDDLAGEIEPLKTHYQQQKDEELKDAFYKAHADLKDWEPITMKVIDDFKREGVRFETREDGFKAVSTRVRDIITKLPGVAAAEKKAQPATKMPALSHGGQGGSANGEAKPKSKSAGMAVFD